jgi:2-hydroxy-3-keto-5-methylthiopentenyl-1-phosphate phosphatase
MRFSEVLELLEEVGQSLLLLDIDDTLVVPQNIKIYKKTPQGEVGLTPAEYSREKITPETKKDYDYREFRDPEKIYNSIQTGLPIVSNLKIFDEYVKRGWKIGILTARGMEDLVYNSLKDWLKHKDASGNLNLVGDKLVRDLVHAVNDDKKKYEGKTDFEKKANVIQKLAKEYDRIVFIDDDAKNITAVKNLGLKNVYPRLANKMEK